MNKKHSMLLEIGLNKLNLDLPHESQAKLLEFIELLYKWNQIHNFTAIEDLEQMVYYHLLDSLIAIPFLKGFNSVLDVGTGPGIPGIPLAIAMPETNFTLIDSKHKKVKFVQHAIRCLKLSNVEVYHARIEKLSANKKYPLIISRAFSQIDKFASISGHLCQQRGVLLAYKGKMSDTEKNSLPVGYEVSDIKEVEVPGVNSHRSLVIINKL